jgi:hypothetical protein
MECSEDSQVDFRNKKITGIQQSHSSPNISRSHAGGISSKTKPTTNSYLKAHKIEKLLQVIQPYLFIYILNLISDSSYHVDNSETRKSAAVLGQ